MNITATQHRNVSRTYPSLKTTEGGGVTIHRAFPIATISGIDPFLLLDHMGPLDFTPGDNTGFPAHPHRGFETVTYLLSGQMAHRDSFGNRGLLNPGDVQWMTAGSGLVHSEMPGPELVRDGGTLEGFQLWVNLPRTKKMIAPHYQDTPAARIPTVQRDGVRVRVIAGEALGTPGVIHTEIPVTYLHAILNPGAAFEHNVPATHNAFAYVISGEAVFEPQGEHTGSKRVAIFANDPGSIYIGNEGAEPLSILLIAGEPLGEPVARYGPFVMNTKQELVEAYQDFQSGRMGRLSE